MAAVKRKKKSKFELAPEESRIDCRPFLKWAGGKASIARQLAARLPASFNSYYEPFLGGGALFFAIQPKRAVLSDINAELINLYRVVQTRADKLIADLAVHKHTKTYFYRIRGADRRADFWVWSNVEKASRFLYLNKTCFNGLYRVNSRGEFNVPFGDYRNPKIADEKNLRACSAALAGAELRHGGYERILKEAAKGDFVYFDPPFVPVSRTANFTSYAAEGFGVEEQLALRDYCRELDSRGVKFMLSNSYTSPVLEMYAEFRIDTLEAPRAINADARGRGKIKEAVVMNYQP